MSAAIRPIEDRRPLGIGFVVAGYLGFTVIDSCAKYLATKGLPSLEIAFVRYAAQLIVVSAVFFPQRGLALVRTRNLGGEVVRGLSLMASTICNFFALIYLPLTTTSAIGFTSPLILCALSVPILGEKVGWRRWLAIAVGFVGVVVIVHPGTATFHPAAILSIFAAATGALYMLMNRKLAGVDSTTTQQFYAGLVATICIGPFALGGWVWPSTLDGWIAFFLIGIAALVAHQLMSTAHRYAPASVLAPFSYSQIFFMTASSLIVFNQAPEFWLYLGAPIVIGSGLYLWLREMQLSKVVSEMPQDR